MLKINLFYLISFKTNLTVKKRVRGSDLLQTRRKTCGLKTDIIQSFKIGSSQLTYCLLNERDVPFKYLNCSKFKYAIYNVLRLKTKELEAYLQIEVEC